MQSPTLINPFEASLQVARLEQEFRNNNLAFYFGTEAAAFRRCKKDVRNSVVTPYFDESVTKLSGDRFFWCSLSTEAGEIIGLQAFRLDRISESLADWVLNFTIGLYMRRGELLVPSATRPAVGSIADRLTGDLVYHGELWISPQCRSRYVFNCFTRIGILLSALKWNPDAIWAVTTRSMANHGHPTRMGYSHVEGGFLRWQWKAEDIPSEEWLLACDRHSLNQLIANGTSDLAT